MIRVERRPEVRPSLFEEGGRADDERRANAKRLAEKPGSELSFEVYRDDKVKRALTELFHGKCAYCETRYSASQPMDVEHWRPKSIYWWLAADWDNLLPSCVDCNRRRWHEVRETGERRKLGKKDLFPLAPAIPLARRPGVERDEVPLLVNPCAEDPAEHLRFPALTETERSEVAAGNAPLQARGHLQPRKPRSAGGTRAYTSIEVYGLNRPGLVQERAERRLLLVGKMHTIAGLGQTLQAIQNEAPRRPVVEMLKREMAELERFLGSDQPYAAMARQVAKPFIDQLKGKPAA